MRMKKKQKGLTYRHRGFAGSAFHGWIEETKVQKRVEQAGKSRGFRCASELSERGCVMKVGSVKVGLKSRSMKGCVKDKPGGAGSASGTGALTKDGHKQGPVFGLALVLFALC